MIEPSEVLAARKALFKAIEDDRIAQHWLTALNVGLQQSIYNSKLKQWERQQRMIRNTGPA